MMMKILDLTLGGLKTKATCPFRSGGSSSSGDRKEATAKVPMQQDTSLDEISIRPTQCSLRSMGFSFGSVGISC